MTQFKYQMIIQWSEEDHCYLVGLPEFPGQTWRTHGDTYQAGCFQSRKLDRYLLKIIRKFYRQILFYCY